MKLEQVQDFDVSFNLTTGNSVINGYHGLYSNFYNSELGLPNESPPSDVISIQNNTLKIPGQIMYQGKWFNVVNFGYRPLSVSNIDGKYSFAPNIQSQTMKVIEFDPSIQPIMSDIDHLNSRFNLYFYNDVNNNFNEVEEILNLPLGFSEAEIKCPNLTRITFNQKEPKFGLANPNGNNVLITAPEFFRTNKCINYDIPDFVEQIPSNFISLTTQSPSLTYEIKIPKNLKVMGDGGVFYLSSKDNEIGKINFIVNQQNRKKLEEKLNYNKPIIYDVQITINNEPFTFTQTNTPKL